MSNDFLVFAGAGGANVVSQSTYASMGALAGGFVTGIAESNQLNKVWRQSSIMSAVLAQYISDITGANSVDDGTTATLLGNLLTSVQAGSYANDTSGAANSYTLTYSPAPVTPLTKGAVYRFVANHGNTTTSTLSINGSPAKAIISQTGGALTGGEIATGGMVTVIYDGTSSFILQSSENGIQHGPTASLGDNSTKLATTAFVQANGGVSGTVGASGYIQFANGIILQWRNVTAGSPTGTFAWPTSFPTAFFAAVASTGPSGAGGYVTITSPSTTGASWALGGTSSSTFYVFAIGH